MIVIGISRSWLAAPFLLFLLDPLLPQGVAAEEPRIRNLQGISGFELIVEKPTEDARQAGIKEEAIREQIHALFKNHLPKVSLKAKEGPSLYVRVVLHKRQDEALYYGMINLTVDRPVLILSPQGNFPSFSQVWENTMVFSGRDPLLAVYEVLPRLVRLLIADFKKANSVQDR